MEQAAWLEKIALSLQLSGDTGVLILLNRAHPACLRQLVLHLLPHHPDLDVLDGVAALDQVTDGSVLVLLPRKEEADWLNLHRPIFSRRRLRVVLFCTEEVTQALLRHAPDFFDWISRHVTCPAEPAPHAVFGLQALLRSRVAGCIFSGGPVAPLVAAAAPDRGLAEVDAQQSYDEIVEAVEEARERIICFTGAGSDLQVRRLRWALAEARHELPAVLLDTGVRSPGWWRLHDRFLDLGEAIGLLAGVAHPGRLAALSGLEPEAVHLCARLLRSGSAMEQIEEMLRQAVDPGAALAGIVDPLRVVEVASGEAAPPMLRGLWDHVEVSRLVERWRKRVPGHWTHAGRIVARLSGRIPVETSRYIPGYASRYLAEAVLRGDRDAAAWAWLIEAARDAQDLIVAQRWLNEALGRYPDDALLLALAGRLEYQATVIAEPRARAGAPVAATLLSRLKGLSVLLGGHLHPDLADLMDQLAVHYTRRGRYEEAGRLLEEAIDIWEKTVGPNHLDLARGLEHLMDVRLREHRLKEASECAARARAIKERNRRGGPSAEGPPARPKRPVELVYLYSPRDSEWLRGLEAHLQPLVREGILRVWSDRHVRPGQLRAQAVRQHLLDADIILLLLSPDFLADPEQRALLDLALNRMRRGHPILIPVELRPIYIPDRLRGIEILPRDGQSFSTHEDPDLAWLEIVDEIHRRAAVIQAGR